MRGVPGLDDDIERGALGRHIQKHALMGNFQNVRAGLAQQGGDISQNARLVGSHQPEGNDLFFLLKAKHDN